MYVGLDYDDDDGVLMLVLYNITACVQSMKGDNLFIDLLC